MNMKDGPFEPLDDEFLVPTAIVEDDEEASMRIFLGGIVGMIRQLSETGIGPAIGEAWSKFPFLVIHCGNGMDEFCQHSDLCGMDEY